MRSEAIFALYTNVISVDEEHGCFDSSGNLVTIDEVLVSAKIAELQAAEPMRLLREQRNQLLAQTDWRFRSDLTPSQAWIDYCQALRDITTQSPSLDSNGNLTGVTWPTLPTD